MDRPIAISVILLVTVGLCCGAVAAEYHVAQDGSGDFELICEAVYEAENNDTIIVHPGIYHDDSLAAYLPPRVG